MAHYNQTPHYHLNNKDKLLSISIQTHLQRTEKGADTPGIHSADAGHCSPVLKQIPRPWLPAPSFRILLQDLPKLSHTQKLPFTLH